MGKKSSSSAPAIDPSVGIAMNKQAELAQKQQDWYEQEIYPWMKQQTEQQNEWALLDRQDAKDNQEWYKNYLQSQTDRLNEQSDAYYNRWNELYKPVEDALIADAKNYNTSAEAARQAEAAMADNRMSFDAQRQAANMQAQQYGYDPTSGAYQAQNRALDIQQAGVQAAAANQARQAAVELGWNKKMQVAQLGQNYIGNSLNAAGAANSVMGTAGGLMGNSLGQASGFGQLGTQNISNLANVGLQSYQSMGNAWGQYGQMGMGVSNYNMQAYQTDLQNKQSQQQGVGQMVGTAAGVAMAAL